MAYSKTNPGGAALTPRARRGLLIVGVLVVLALGGLGLWSALASDADSASGQGCVSMNVPSSTGGALIHYCGNQAKAFCHDAYIHTDRISLLARPHCRQAGLAGDNR
jgi:hypothetical protein